MVGTPTTRPKNSGYLAGPEENWADLSGASSLPPGTNRLPGSLAGRMLARMSADPITRLNAALEGRYRIERELGEEMKQE